ncbi:MAG TPA: lysyl oxidase family protein [Solirubrobacterales bacterium]|nr:lysyl oxidase family protein [Solirubrobacterales bacterium]
MRRVVAAGTVGLACVGAALLLLSSSHAAAGGASGPSLLPDLVVEAPEEIVLQRSPHSKNTFLRFSHTTSNVGAGPLEIYPDLETDTCGDEGNRGRVAYQTIYQDSNASGTFQRGVDTETTDDPVGCMIFHEIHSHYHFEDFASYELYRAKSGQLKEISDKVSFCVVDILNTHPGVPGAAEDPFYNFENCQTDSGIHGISVGWADIYGSATPGQEFEVSDRNAGRYCLVARTDPLDRIEEIPTGGEDNNLQTVQIRMNKKNASEFGTSVPILGKPCSPPTP